MKGKQRMLLVLLSLLLVVALGSFGVMAADDFADMPEKDHWSYNALTAAVDNGLLEGYDGKIHPKDALTRAQISAIMVRAYGALAEADISRFTDVASTNWFYDEMQKAVQMGIVQGTSATTLEPNNEVTREQAFVIIARALCLDDGTAKDLENVPDKNDISDWAQGSIAALLANGYIQGYDDGSIRPKNSISREEFAQTVYELCRQYITEKSTVSEVADGNIIVKADGVVLKDVTVNGDLILAEGIGNGSVILENADLKGRLVVRGGGVDGVKLVDTEVKNMSVAKTFDGELQINNTTATPVENLSIKNNTGSVTLKGSYKTVNVAVADANLVLAEDSEVEKIKVQDGCTANIVIPYMSYPLNVDVAENKDITVTTAYGKPVEIVDGHIVEQPFDVDVKQKDINYTTVSIQLNDYNALLKSGVDSVKVTAQMRYDGDVTRNVEQTFDLQNAGTADVKKSRWNDTLDLADFGKFYVTVDFLDGEKIVHSEKDKVVGVVAEEYNLAPLAATFPVTLYTMSLWDISQQADGDPIPTIICLERSQQYDWNNLPEMVYPLPSATIEDVTTSKANLWKLQLSPMKQYVKDLYELNPDSHFNYYVNDLYATGIANLFIANGIPESKYNAFLLSDGAATRVRFTNLYDVDDPQSKYDQLAAHWQAVKDTAKNTGGIQEELLVDYGYVIAKEESNVEWWMSRPDYIALSNEEGNVNQKTFMDAFDEVWAEKIKDKRINDMLLALQAKGDDVVAEFKAIYNFSDSYFSKAEEANKEVMMILGAGLGREGDLKNYILFLKEYYGDEYIYYYKGHPRTPTMMYPDKLEMLEELDVIDVDSSVAAELIMFFNPGIYLSGYSSTSFESMESEEKCCCLFMRKSSAAADSTTASYRDKMDVFISPFVEADKATYGEDICPAGATCYLVEFNAESEAYDIAIWNATDSQLKYYKNVEGTYEEVV